jgi:hypothetical protein
METRVPAAGRDPNAVAGLVTVVVAAASALDPFAGVAARLHTAEARIS